MFLAAFISIGANLPKAAGHSDFMLYLRDSFASNLQIAASLCTKLG